MVSDKNCEYIAGALKNFVYIDLTRPIGNDINKHNIEDAFENATCNIGLDSNNDRIFEEYTYFRIFLIDYFTYTILGECEKEQRILDFFYVQVKEMLATLTDNESMNMHFISQMAKRINSYGEVVRKNENGGSRTISELCQQLFINSEIDPNGDQFGEFMQFEMTFFVPQWQSLFEAMKKLLAVDDHVIGEFANKSAKTTASNGTGCLVYAIGAICLLVLAFALV